MGWGEVLTPLPPKVETAHVVHYGCNYTAVYTTEDRVAWFCAKCGNGGPMPAGDG